MARAAPPPPAPFVQLVLPLLASEDGVSNSGVASLVLPQQVWVSLPPMQRDQLRHTLVSLLEEMCHERG